MSLWVAASQAAEKVNSMRLLVAQALLPVRVLLHLSSMHSQEWLCYSTFSAACSDAGVFLANGRQTPAAKEPSYKFATAGERKGRHHSGYQQNRVSRPKHLVRGNSPIVQERLLANLGLALPLWPELLMKFHKPHCPFDRLFLRLQFKHRVPAEDFLSLSERPVSDGNFPSR